MKVKIALQGDFLNLLYLEHPDGKPVATIDRLNQLLKNEDWLNKNDHRKMISIIGPRIPVQGLNSMEFAEVYEFLPAEAGNIVILPSEIVSKSGGDYDIDKLTFMMPSINASADYSYWNTQEGKEKLEIIRQANPALQQELSAENIQSILENKNKQELTETDKLILKVLKDTPAKKISYAKGNDAKGLENKILDNMRSILEMERNFVDLIRPNDTDIVRNEWTEKLAEYVSDFNFKTSTLGKNRVPGTRMFEIRYNLYKHTSNNIGKQTLGLGAVDNTYNALLNRIGARMNASYTTDNGLEKELRLLLPHRKLKDEKGNDVISLSHEMDVNNENSVSDVISQLINGWVDIAKDAWIFIIQGNKEVAPVLLFMIQAGVPIKQAVYMAANPMIRQYVKEQKMAKSIFAGPLGKSAGDPKFYRNQARKVILGDKKYGINIDEKTLGNSKDLERRLDTMLKGFVGEKGTVKEFFNEDKIEDNLLKRVEDFYKKKKDPSIKEKDLYTNEDRALFLHFLEIEEMSKSLTAIKTKTNVDTAKSANLFEAEERLLGLEELKKDGKFPEWMIQKLIGDANGKGGSSPIASFNILNFQIDLWKDFFRLKTNKTFTNYILGKTREKGFREVAEKSYGDSERFVKNFRNNLLSFIYQNYMNNVDIENTKKYKGLNAEYTVETVPSLTNGAYVKTNAKGDKVLLIDKMKLKNDFLNLDSLRNTPVAKVSLPPAAAFPTAKDYYSFIFEREILRSQNPFATSLERLKERADVKALYDFYTNNKGTYTKEEIDVLVYEETLKNMALDNTFNMWQIFKSRNSTADQLVQIQATYPELVKQYSILQNINPSVSNKDGVRVANIKLADTTLDGDRINIYHQNLTELSDPSRIKLNNVSEQEKLRVAEYFKRLSTYAFLQSGLNVSGGFSLIRVVPQTRLTSELTLYAEDFMKNINTITLDRYWDKFISVSQNYNLRNRFKDFSVPYFNIENDAKWDARIKDSPFEKTVTVSEEILSTDNSGNIIYKKDKGDAGINQDEAEELIKENPDVVFVADGSSTTTKSLFKARLESGNVVSLNVAKRTTDMADLDSSQATTTTQPSTSVKEGITEQTQEKMYYSYNLADRAKFERELQDLLNEGKESSEVMEALKEDIIKVENKLKEVNKEIEEYENKNFEAKQVGEVKEGVSELFESNPELAKIGTQEQYSQYLEQGGKEQDIEGFKQFVSKDNNNKLFQESGSLATMSQSKIDNLQNTVEYQLLTEKDEDIDKKVGQSYMFLSEKDAQIFTFLVEKNKEFPKEFKVTKKITKYEKDSKNSLKYNGYNEYTDFYYIKSNNNKKSNLYDIVNKETGEIIASKVRILSVSKDSKSEIAKKYGLEHTPTKVFNANRSIAFALYRQKPSKAKYIAQAKKYLYDAIKFLNSEETNLKINLDKIEELLNSFPEEMWDYINTTYSPEDSTNINASISLQNEIKFNLPKLGFLQEIEKITGLKLLGTSFKNYDKSGRLAKVFKYSKLDGEWGSTITIDNSMTTKELKASVRYYLSTKNIFKPSSEEENVRKYAEHRGIDYNELRELVFGDIDKALDNIAYNETGNSDTIELSKWRESIRNYDWQSAELFSKPYENFQNTVKKRITEKFKDKKLSNGMSHLEYFFNSGSFNWLNINFNNISGQYYMSDMETEANVGVKTKMGGIINPFEMKIYQKPKAGENFLQEKEVFNRLAAILHEPFHALHALSYGTKEELELRKAFDNLYRTDFGKEMMNQVFGSGYNKSQQVSYDTLYKEFTAFTTQLMLYPKQWIKNTDLRSNDIYEFIEKIQTLQDKTYEEIVKTQQKIGTIEKTITEEEQIKLSFLEKLYNYLVKALNKIIPLSKQFTNLIVDSKLVDKQVIEDVFGTVEENVIKTLKLPENVKKSKEQFLEAMEELQSAINTLMQIDGKLFSSENVTNFFTKKQFNQEEGSKQDIEGFNEFVGTQGTVQPATIAEAKQVATFNAEQKGINPDIKNKIDTVIQSMIDYQKSGKKLAFPQGGLGQFLIGADPISGQIIEGKTPIGKATFVYLSQQLYKNFKYVNPNFEQALYNKETIKSKPIIETITEEQIQQQLDFLDKNCG